MHYVLTAFGAPIAVCIRIGISEADIGCMARRAVIALFSRQTILIYALATLGQEWE